MTQKSASAGGIESPYAWTRLFVSLLLMTIGGSGVYTVAVVLPLVQADFGIARGDASLPYTAAMIGFGLGGVFMGRLADRFGAMVPVLIGAVGLGSGFIAAGASDNLWQFSIAQGLLMAFAASLLRFA
jgi:MFS family permease